MKTIAEIRWDNLMHVERRFKTVAALAELADVSAVYLSQIKARTPESKTGTPKQMGDKVARKIEAAIKVPSGWMDMQHGENDGGGPLLYDPTDSAGQITKMTLEAVSNAAQQLTNSEQGGPLMADIADLLQLITLWAKADHDGRKFILSTVSQFVSIARTNRVMKKDSA